MAPLAHYNLGLVAVAEHKEEQAARWFAQARSETSDERLQSLSTDQLARLPRPVERNWYAYGAVAAGYDDNVALVSNGDVLGVTASTMRSRSCRLRSPHRSGARGASTATSFCSTTRTWTALTS
jgi:hypothetical protein